MEILNSARQAYAWFDDLVTNHGDKRVDGWFMMSGPAPTALVCVTYGVVVKVLGPWLMRDRKPFDLRSFIVLYNFLQTLFSIWLFQYVLYSGWVQHYSLRCQPVDYSDDPLAVRMVHASWWYYMSKFSEFMDTVFFVLRKKFEHISVLHVVHHGIMPMSVWFGVKFMPGGHSTFFGLINTFVHIVMYFYYMVAAMGPQYHKYLWWKKYLTSLQMVQFVLIIAHAFQLLIFECDYPKSFAWFIGLHAVLFFFLFLDFFRNAYLKKPATGREKPRDEVAFRQFIPCLVDLDRTVGASSVKNGLHRLENEDYLPSNTPKLRHREKQANGIKKGGQRRNWEE